ncbi:uncharacterized protein LOC120196858 [Hibiscus syriacus]|uniref:uncharacterized protein LOC120196858 n=1 Tax=Hibiscus syriacus TaxID=106335 RepID=UPI001921A422|nr:uncharacterized protein LOC120196858 [Hibiscus syriacus]
MIDSRIWLNLIFVDSANHDPGVNEDTETHFAELLTEGLKLEKLKLWKVSNVPTRHYLRLRSERLSIKRSGQMHSGMEACEEAREKAEEALSAQMKLTARWEIRARQKGWREKVHKSRTQLQGNLQFV